MEPQTLWIPSQRCKKLVHLYNKIKITNYYRKTNLLKASQRSKKLVHLYNKFKITNYYRKTN